MKNTDREARYRVLVGLDSYPNLQWLQSNSWSIAFIIACPMAADVIELIYRYDNMSAKIILIRKFDPDNVNVLKQEGLRFLLDGYGGCN